MTEEQLYRLEFMCGWRYLNADDRDAIRALLAAHDAAVRRAGELEQVLGSYREAMAADVFQVNNYLAQLKAYGGSVNEDGYARAQRIVAADEAARAVLRKEAGT